MTATIDETTAEEAVTPTEPLEPDQGAEVEPQMTMRDRQARMGRLLAFDAEFKKFMADEREALFEAFMAAREDSGAKSFTHTFGPKQSVAFTLRDSDEKIIVSNEAELTDWLLDNHPEETETITRPRDAFVKVLIKRAEAKHVTSDDDEQVTIVIDPETGEEIPGLKFVPSSDPTSFGTRWTGGDEAKAAALAEVLEGGLPVLLGLPAGGDE